MKILVDRDDFQELVDLTSDPCEDTICCKIHNKIKQIYVESPIVSTWTVVGEETKEITSLIDITNDLRRVASRIEQIRLNKEKQTSHNNTTRWDDYENIG